MNLGRELLSLLIYEVEVDRVADLELLRRQVVLPLGRVIPGEGNLISVLFLNGEDLGGHVDVRNLSLVGAALRQGRRADQNKREHSERCANFLHKKIPPRVSTARTGPEGQACGECVGRLGPWWDAHTFISCSLRSRSLSMSWARTPSIALWIVRQTERIE